MVNEPANILQKQWCRVPVKSLDTLIYSSEEEGVYKLLSGMYILVLYLGLLMQMCGLAAI